MANQVCSNCNHSHNFQYPQNKIQCQCGNTVSLSSQLSTIEQNEIDVHDIYEMSDKDNFTNDESAENSTTSSTATEQKKTSKWVYIVLVLFFIGLINYMLPWKCAGCNEKITQNSAYNYRGALVDKDMWTGGKNELYHGRCWQADDLFK